MSEVAIHGFLTVACLGHYAEVCSELLESLIESGLYERSRSIRLALLGPASDRAVVKALIRPFDKVQVATETDDLTEYEFPALELLQDFCRGADAHVFYLHTKGVSHSPLSQHARHWRALMLHHVVERHAECLQALTQHDAAGTNWRGNHFSGNFWWARAAHVRRLPELRTLRQAPVSITHDPVWNLRLQCEFWIGMAPGHFKNFGPQNRDLNTTICWPTSATQVAQRVLEANGGLRFLELAMGGAGMFVGAIRAERKHLVSPHSSATFAMSEQEFIATQLGEPYYDLIVIDSWHEDARCLAALEWALTRVDPGGAILVHDTNPPTAWHQRPGSEYAAGTEWNGDVWKSVVRFRSRHPDIDVTTVDTDWGCTLIRPGLQATQPLGVEALDGLSYECFERNRTAWLNLVSVGRFERELTRWPAALSQRRQPRVMERDAILGPSPGGGPLAQDPPLVSCVLVTYDRRGFLPHALCYFLRQDYANKELIVVDDGTDPVGDLVPEHASIRYIRLPAKLGLGVKLNFACEQARGSLIARWDDDDWYAPWRLSRQVEVMLQHPAIELCGINDLLYYDLSGQAHRYVYPADQRPWLLGSSLLFRRTAWQRTRFAEVDLGEDAMFAWAMPAESVYVMLDSSFAVHMIHRSNCCAKNTAGAWWHALPRGEIAAVMGDDWKYYAPRGEPLSWPRPRSGAEAADLSARQTSAAAAMPGAPAAAPFRNVYACLVHEAEDCVVDLVRNLRCVDPDSDILLYDGGQQGGLLTNTDAYGRLGAILHPAPRAMSWGYLHPFALDSIRYALEHLRFDTLTIVDSDQLALRDGWCARLGACLAEHAGAGLLGNAPERQLADTRCHPAITAWQEFALWQPYLRRFRDGEEKFVHWTFWPSTVVTVDAARELVHLFDHDEALRDTLSRSRLWATEEILFPTLIALLGFRVVASPASYDYVRYRAGYGEADVQTALAQPDAYWMHPVPRRYDDPLRQAIRNHHGTRLDAFETAPRLRPARL